MQQSNAVSKMSFKEFIIDASQKIKLSSNTAARIFNMNPSSEIHGYGTGRVNREMILFRANRIAVNMGQKKQFKDSDADRSFSDFNEFQREVIIYALNEISNFGHNLPVVISLADCRLNL